MDKQRVTERTVDPFDFGLRLSSEATPGDRAEPSGVTLKHVQTLLVTNAGLMYWTVLLQTEPILPAFAEALHRFTEVLNPVSWQLSLTLGGEGCLANQLKGKQTLVKQGMKDVVQDILEQNLKKGMRS